MSNRAMRVELAAVLVAIVLLLGLSSVAVAQSFSFTVQENRVDLFVDQDGTVRIQYYITFLNDPGAPVIDIFDVGMPNDNYSNVAASIDGKPLSGVGPSSYIDTGVEVPLSPYAIPPGRSATVYLEATVRNLIYQDTEDESYASIEFSRDHAPPGQLPLTPGRH
jgi:hypothetical protein